MKKFPIVVLCGQKGAGKDTTAELIQQIVSDTELIAFADPIKELAEGLFGFTQQQLNGPSHFRDNNDTRFDDEETWEQILSVYNPARYTWLNKYFGEHKDIGVKFADWIKNFKESTFDQGTPVSCRLVLQQLGTEFGRSVENDVWYKAAHKRALQLLNGKARLVVIKDGRFRSEVLNSMRDNLLVVKIINLDDLKPKENTYIHGHSSEKELKTIPEYWFDELILNKKTGTTELKDNVVLFCQRWIEA